MDGQFHRLPQPPTAPPLQEPPAIIEPPLRDSPPPPGGEIGQWEAVESERRALAPAEELMEVARRALLAHDQARAVVEGPRTIVLGASQLVDDKENEQRPRTMVVLYDYEQGQAVEVIVGEEAGESRVESVEPTDRQPSLSDEETERAITLAREADRVAPHLSEEWVANALLTSDVSPGDQYYGQRRVVVVFGPPDERLPRVRVLVDLQTDAVLGMDVHSDTLDEGGTP
jgi:hypothetical protein